MGQPMDQSWNEWWMWFIMALIFLAPGIWSTIKSRKMERQEQREYEERIARRIEMTKEEARVDDLITEVSEPKFEDCPMCESEEGWNTNPSCGMCQGSGFILMTPDPIRKR